MCESIYRALTCLSSRDSQQDNVAPDDKGSKTILAYKWSIGLILASILLLIISKYIEITVVRYAAMLFLVAGYIGLISSPIVLAVLYRKNLARFLLNPLSAIINNARKKSTIDSKYLRFFMSRNKSSLEKVLLELKSERDAFAMRISLIVGAIEKVGLFPGIAGLFVTFC